MQIATWIKDRSTPGKLAHLARRILETDSKYRDIEKTLKSLYILEAVIKHGCHQQKAAEAIGVSSQKVSRTLRSFGLSMADIRRMAMCLEIKRRVTQ